MGRRSMVVIAGRRFKESEGGGKGKGEWSGAASQGGSWGRRAPMIRLQCIDLSSNLLDDEDGDNDVSAVTNSEWSEMIQNILGSTPVNNTVVSVGN
ncbi:hypothetical protein L6452_43442 [Arctium lappa]|uniref:Uncharacterized protein n=1 Tax=Arctium lappa TaxID=4217 RepID=A0ACB8XDG0_ARCLA|nr:hypothetical protein L6452_43442 [Arctium lappa]